MKYFIADKYSTQKDRQEIVDRTLREYENSLYPRCLDTEKIDTLINLLENTKIAANQYGDLDMTDIDNAIQKCYSQKMSILLSKGKEQAFCLLCRKFNERTGQTELYLCSEQWSGQNFHELQNEPFDGVSVNFMLIDKRLLEGFKRELVDYNNLFLFEQLGIIQML